MRAKARLLVSCQVELQGWVCAGCVPNSLSNAPTPTPTHTPAVCPGRRPLPAGWVHSFPPGPGLQHEQTGCPCAHTAAHSTHSSSHTWLVRGRGLQHCLMTSSDGVQGFIRGCSVPPSLTVPAVSCRAGSPSSHRSHSSSASCKTWCRRQ